MANSKGVNRGASRRIIKERDGVKEASGIRMAGGRGETGDDARGGGRNGEGSSGPSALGSNNNANLGSNNNNANLGSNNNNAIPGSNEGDNSEDGSKSTIGRRDTD